MTKKQKRKGIVSYLMYILIGAIVGFLIVSFTTQTFGSESLIKSESSGFILNIVFILAAIMAAIYIQIIIHESGHLIFGLLSGYKFVSFRVGSLTLIKKSGKLLFKRYRVAGTGGQCLMMPPEALNDNFPYKLYNLGGVLLNFIFSLIAILIITFLDPPVFSFDFLLIFAIFGILISLLNGIPMRPNDGYHIRSLSKDKISRRVFYLQLKINGLLSEGVRLKEMPEEWFESPENADMKNSLHLSIILFKSAWYMDQLRFDEARKCLESMEPYQDNLIGLYQKERDCELLFLEIIGECRPDVISKLYTVDLIAYIKQYSKYMFSKKRILYTYTIAVENDKVKADTIFNEALRMQDKYPIIGDAESELEIMEYVRKRYI
ncbi:MAG: hypothetical protein ACK5KT_02455 [Dysgonomonas sp.]